VDRNVYPTCDSDGSEQGEEKPNDSFVREENPFSIIRGLDEYDTYSTYKKDK
jgi:hypothetical protein